MENNKGFKVMTICALVAAVVGLSLGFAAFSNTLTISSSAEVTPSSDTFKVYFSSSDEGVVTEKIGAVDAGTVAGATGDEATITNEASDGTNKIEGLNAKFTKPGQKVTYSFYVHNIGEYPAYLKSLSVTSAPTVCQKTADSEASADLVSGACAGISMSVKLNETEYTTSTTAFTTNRVLAVNGMIPVVVTIDYASTASPVDGPIEVEFDGIELKYSSAQ